MLSGRLPYNVNHRQLPEAARTIREDEPTSLSSVSRNFRGDIETIVGKVLEKDKARRYSSAAAMARLTTRWEPAGQFGGPRVLRQLEAPRPDGSQ